MAGDVLERSVFLPVELGGTVSVSQPGLRGFQSEAEPELRRNTNQDTNLSQ